MEADVKTDPRAARPPQSGCRPWTRDQIAANAARDIPEGSYVNIGIGIPVLVANHVPAEREVIIHSENGILGMGPEPGPNEINRWLINASKKYVTLRPGGAYMHHADSFAIIRGGHLDLCILGAFQLAENGDFANWKMAGQKGGGIGGAMDLAACAKRVFVAMEQVTRSGRPRLVERCAIPVTARGVVDLVMTNYGLFEITPEGMALKEIAPGISVDEVKASTGCNLIVPREVPPVRLRG